MKYKNILFDLDGTLTDPYMGITNSIYHSLKYYPHISVPKREELKPFIGPPLYASYMKYFSMDEKTAHEAVEHYREYYSEKGKLENLLYSGIKEFLFELKERGFSVAMATSKPQVFAEYIAEHYGIMESFDYICGSTFDARLIEKADIIKKVMDEMGYSANETAMVGDTAFDIEGAKQNGIASVAVSYGYGTENDLKNAEPDVICESVAELRSYFIENA